MSPRVPLPNGSVAVNSARRSPSADRHSGCVPTGVRAGEYPRCALGCRPQVRNFAVHRERLLDDHGRDAPVLVTRRSHGQWQAGCEKSAHHSSVVATESTSSHCGRFGREPFRNGVVDVEFVDDVKATLLRLSANAGVCQRELCANAGPPEDLPESLRSVSSALGRCCDVLVPPGAAQLQSERLRAGIDRPFSTTEQACGAPDS